MEYFSITDPGKVRDHNEDNVIISENKNCEVLMAIADGMGGHNAGEVASSIAVTHLGQKFSSLATIGSYDDAVIWIKETVSEINQQIYQHTLAKPQSQGMGTTLVLSILTKEFLVFGNIGDSSGYVMRNGKLHKITQDHTLVSLLISTGELTDAEAKNHPRKNVLMKALGSMTNIDMDIFHVENEIEGIFLCSDGLTNMLDDEQINKVLNEDTTIEDKLHKLILKSNNRGGPDNISAAFLTKGGAK